MFEKKVSPRGAEAQWATWGTKAGFESQTLRRGLLPSGFAEGSAAMGAAPQRLQFGLCLGLTDILQPLLSWPQRPIGERHRWALIDAVPQARPTPLLGRSHEVGTHGVALDEKASRRIST